MRRYPLEDDEDWGVGAGADDPEEEAELRQAGGPLRCWQRAGLKRVTIDERRLPVVRPARYDAGPCCGVCGGRPDDGRPLELLFDNTSFVSMADVLKDVVGMEFTESENPHENVVCSRCRGHLLALHMMRGWLHALQKQFVRMVVCTNNGRRSAKILVPKAYRGVDFYTRVTPPLQLPKSGNELLRPGAADDAARTEDGGGQSMPETSHPVAESDVTSVPEFCSEQVVQTEPPVAEGAPSGSEQTPESVVREQSDNCDGEAMAQELFSDVPASASETLTTLENVRPADTAVSESQQVPTSLQPQSAPESHLAQPPLPTLHPAPGPRQHTPQSPLRQGLPPPPLSQSPLRQGLPPPPLSQSPLRHAPPPPVFHQSPSALPAAPLTSTAQPATPPRPAPLAGSGEDDDLHLDPFEEYPFSELLVLRSPLVARAPAAPERPPPAKLKKIAPKSVQREAAAPPAQPIVLNIMSVPVPAPAPGTHTFKPIVPRQTGDGFNHDRAAPAAPAADSGRIIRRRPRRLTSVARDSGRPHRGVVVEAPPPQHHPPQQLPPQPPPQQHQHQPPPPPRRHAPTGYEPMVFYNPDGSIPAPPYAGQMEAAPAGMSAPGPAGGAGEYAQLQTVQPEQHPPPHPQQQPLPPDEYRHQVTYEVSHEEIERYTAEYGVYMDQSAPPPPPQQPPPQQQQQEEDHRARLRELDAQDRSQPPPPAPPAPEAAAVGSSSATSDHQVSLEDSTNSEHEIVDYRVLPRICKPCGEQIGSEMMMLRKHFVEFHMGLERNELTGSIIYRCRVCTAKSTSLEQLRKHFGTTHVRRSAVMCGRCDQTFPHREALQYHIRRQHTNRPACPECGVCFLTSRALRIHRSRVHRTSRREASHSPPPDPDDLTEGPAV